MRAAERPVGSGVCVLSNDDRWVATPSGTDFLVVRVTFEKTGRARFISHLDLNRTMTRALRRAGLPIWYTEGFNKHPYVTFAAPLSLGYESEAESMDIRLIKEVPMEEVAARLDAAMPEGLRVLSAAPAVKKPGDLGGARYRLTFGCALSEMTAFLAQPSISAEKRTKKKELKTIELKPYLADCAAPTAAGENTIWELTLPCGSSDTVNPSLIQQALSAFCGQEISCRVWRLALLDTEGERFA